MTPQVRKSVTSATGGLPRKAASGQKNALSRDNITISPPAGLAAFRGAVLFKETMPYILIAFLSALLFGASTPLSKLLLDSLPPFGLAGLLYLGAALGVLPLCLLKRGHNTTAGPDPSAPDRPGADGRRTRLKTIVFLCGAILFGGMIGPVCVLYGLRLASAASVAMWLNLELAATALLGVLVFKDHLGRAGWIGTCGTIAAALLLSWHEGSAGPAALVFLAAAGIAWALDNHLTALIDGISPAQSTLCKGLAAGTVNLLISLRFESIVFDGAVLAAALGVGALAYGVSISLYILSAQNLGATRSQMIFSAAPFFGVALSVVVLGEAFTGIQILAALILALSLGVLFMESHGHRHTHDAVAHQHLHSHDDHHHDPGHHDHGQKKGASSGSRDTAHRHWHTHTPRTHAHAHWPDLHHRHRH